MLKQLANSDISALAPRLHGATDVDWKGIMTSDGRRMPVRGHEHAGACDAEGEAALTVVPLAVDRLAVPEKTVAPEIQLC